MNISPRLVTYAAKVLQHGCPELIAAVESGGLKVSAAAMGADLPRERGLRASGGRSRLGLRVASGKR